MTRPQCAIWMQIAFGAAGVECAPMGILFYKKWMFPNESGILIPLSFAGCQKYFFDALKARLPWLPKFLKSVILSLNL